MPTDAAKRTLAQLALHELSPVGPSPTGLVRRCRALMTKPLDEFDVEDLRIMLGQQIGVRHLLPLALRALSADPLAEGDFFPGDLLVVVSRLPADAWIPFAHERQQLAAQLRTTSTDDDLVREAIHRLSRT